MGEQEHYLKKELYELVKKDDTIFEFLQSGSLDGIWYWDLEKQENEWMSPEFWKNFGYDPAEKKHLASEWQDMIHPEDLKRAIENFKSHCEDSDHPYDQFVRYTKKDGSTAWVRCRGIAIRDENGTPIRMLGAHVDVTALKNTEARLQKANEELVMMNKFLESTNNQLSNKEMRLVRCEEEVDALLKELGRPTRYGGK